MIAILQIFDKQEGCDCVDFEFLFVDIEWNQKAGTDDIDNRGPVQIGLIGTDESLDIKKSFSKGIRLNNMDDLTEDTCKLLRTCRKNIENAKTLHDVFWRMEQTYSSYRYVVVWNIDSYHLLYKSMKETGIHIPHHKVIVLQEIVNRIAASDDQCVGFEMALKYAKIAYEQNYLHAAKHDVKYLLALFKKMYADYTLLTQNEMNALNARSKIIHTMECRHGYSEHTEVRTGAKSLIFYGYRPCKCCQSENEWRRYQWEVAKPKTESVRVNTKRQSIPDKTYARAELRALPLTDENIKLICDTFKIACNICEDLVFLSTGIGYWRVYLSEDAVWEVYHANHWQKKADYFKIRKKMNEGYHKQAITMTNFYDVVQYIYYHDKNLYKARKKSRIERLFEKIEQDRNVL